MYTGIPVITTATAGMKDVIEDGQNGLLIPPGNAGEIVRAVERLIADASLRERLGRQAFADATRKYTWQAAAEVVNDVYSGVLSLGVV
jgi:glycosyltransferase involved in cell wall biosynthesis